jgi:hypothetical protein
LPQQQSVVIKSHSAEPLQEKHIMTSDFEKSLVTHCAPTLAGIKAGGLFSYSFPVELEHQSFVACWNKILSTKGVRIVILRVCQASALIYVYRSAALLRTLRDQTILDFLNNYGYGNCCKVEEFIDVLKTRICKKTGFPHEIGVFLGYPLRDVIGFIENEGRNYCLCGLWKAYGDKDKAEQQFYRLRKCTSIYRMLFNKGQTVEQLTVAA